MSVLETVTVDNVTYDMHDPIVGTGTLSTTAQTLIPAINELKTGVNKTDVIGTGSLNTTSQTLIGAVNELSSKIGSLSVSSTSIDAKSGTFTATENGIVIIKQNTYGSQDYLTVKDTTNNTVLVYNYSSGGGQFSATVPVIKGHSYTVESWYGASAIGSGSKNACAVFFYYFA